MDLAIPEPHPPVKLVALAGPRRATQQRVNILVLANVDEDGLRDWDVVADQVAAALRQRGHSVDILGVGPSAGRLVAELERRKPELCFNLIEQVGDNLNGDVGVAAILDLLGIPYTGSGPGELYLASDKALGKKLLAFEGLGYPRFAVFGKDADLETGGNLRMPLFVKPLKMDASIGIDGDALVRDANALMRRVLLIHDEIGDDALAEEYIEGRELYVGVLGNGDPVALPPVEIDFTGFPDGAPRVLDERAKWDEGSAEFRGTRSVLAELPDELRARVSKVAISAYRALRVRDYGRVDLRVAETGEIYVLEVNANCYLERGSELAMAARAAGIDHAELVERIAIMARDRATGSRSADPPSVPAAG
jgi:D-alanine-D-alanine ligase